MKNDKEITISDIWNEDKPQGVKELMLLHSKKQSAKRKLRNELLGIQYKLEDYIENNN